MHSFPNQGSKGEDTRNREDDPKIHSLSSKGKCRNITKTHEKKLSTTYRMHSTCLLVKICNSGFEIWVKIALHNLRIASNYP